MGFSPGPLMVHPWASSCSFSGSMGLSGSLPSAANSLKPPIAAATGTIKRRVDPLSLQFILLIVSPSPVPLTSASSRFLSSTSMQSFVAEMSWERPSALPSRDRPERPAAIISLWAADLEGIALTVPPVTGLVILQSIIYSCILSMDSSS